MNNRRIVKAKVVLALSYLLFLVLAAMSTQFPDNVRFGLLGILIIGVLMPLVLPTVIALWANAIMIIIGVAVLVFGYIVMPFYQKIILILGLPLEVILIFSVVSYLFHWSGLGHKNQRLRHNMNHFVPLVRLNGLESARQMYTSEVQAISHQSKVRLGTDLYLFAIDATQYKQFHRQEYGDLLLAVANELKATRLPSEPIFYLGNARFLVFSFLLDPARTNLVNHETAVALDHICKAAGLEVKAASLQVTSQNRTQYPDFEAVMRRLTRSLETEIVTEYLKQED